jgi:sarcosine oxidase
MAGTASRIPLHGSTDFLERTIAIANKFGIQHAVLSTAEIRSRFPQFQLVGDEEGYYEPEMGLLRPELCIESQFVLAEQAGAVFRKNEKVSQITTTANEVHVKTSSGEFTADQAVITAGSWVTRLVERELSRYFKVYRQTMYWFGLKDPVESFLPGRFPIFIWALGSERDDFVYGFPAIDGTRGGIKVASEQHVSETDPDTVDRKVQDEEITAMYRRYIQDRLPGLSDKCLRTSICLYTSTPDSGFVIDRHPSHPNVLIVSPCSGHGFKHSAAVGEIVAELVTKGKSRIDTTKFKLNRFSGK